MTIALVLPSLPQYSERFLSHKMALLQDSGFDLIVLVVGAAREKPRVDFPVYYQPILAASGPQRWLLSLYLIARSFWLQPARTRRLLAEAKKQGHGRAGALRLVAVLSNFLKIKADWVHFAYGTMAVERALIGKVIGAKVGLSFRGYDLCIAPLMRPGLYRKVWPYVDKVHCISRDILQAAQNQGMPKNTPVQVIYPALNAAEFTWQKRSYRGVPRLLTVARLHWKKGLEYTLQALALLHQQGCHFSYTIAGEGSEAERLKFAAYQYGLSGKVHFLGKVAQEAIPKLMQQHNYYLQYSIQEGFCNAVLEAQASGMLCLVSDAEGLPENVLHRESGWVVPRRNPAALAQQLQDVLALPPAEKERISKKANERVLNYFTLPRQQEAFQNFYKA